MSDGWDGLAGMEPNAPEGIDVRRFAVHVSGPPSYGHMVAGRCWGLYAVNLQTRKRTIAPA